MSYELNPKWCPIPGHEKYLISENCNVFSLKTNKILKRNWCDENQEYYIKFNGARHFRDFVWLGKTAKKIFPLKS
jgi:hypothetical protein